STAPGSSQEDEQNALIAELEALSYLQLKARAKEMGLPAGHRTKDELFQVLLDAYL
ncbi:hypothetical protein HaLaN_33145, partial [Haematococcus lacustris]